MSSAEDQIRNLIHRYSEAVDSGQLEILDELFAHANLRVAVGNKAPGPPRPGSATVKTYRDAIRVYADGTPRTRHLVSNTIIEVDEAAGSASARSYNTTLQQVPGKPITVIATAYYLDAFERIGDSAVHRKGHPTRVDRRGYP